MKARALIDSGSQIILVTQALVDRCGLKTVGTEQLRIIGISNVKNQVKNYKIVTLPMASEDGSYSTNIHAIIVKEIPNVTVVGMRTLASHLVNTYDIQLADPDLEKCTNNTIDNIEVLVGSDFSFHIVNAKELPFKHSGVWILPTNFGSAIINVLSSCVEDHNELDLNYKKKHAKTLLVKLTHLSAYGR